MSSTDRALVRAVLDGDVEAGNLFVVRFTRYVYAILLRGFRLPTQVAEDLFQETFLRLMEEDYRRLRLWRGDADYLAPIVKNLALDYLRRAGKDPLADGDGDTGFEQLIDREADPEEEAAIEERRRLVDRAAERLGARDRELYRKRYGEGQLHREIAEEMGMAIGHVGVALLRLERRLERAVGQMIEKREPPGSGSVAVRSNRADASPE